ncbi:MAG TPA: hypothetical protein VKS82_26155 [Streptosporangiaceae bacterium]|nr:hypothetical protein [Streptosporangiaceae bacterium]
MTGALMPAAAQAATSQGSHVTHASHMVVLQVRGAKGTRPDSSCTVGLWNGSSYGPPWGAAICGTTEVSFYNSGTGHWESFVIGTNYSIWHTWTTQSTWYSLGGGFCGASSCGVYGSGGYPNITVAGYGPQGTQLWCDTRTNSGTWPGWYKC